ncbi:MAG: hypothetical protein ABIO61_07925, partial [Thermomonas sp.]
LDEPGEKNQDVVDMNTCGLALRERFGFPDARCPNDSPMAELDGAILAMPDIPENEGEVLASSTSPSSPVAPVSQTAPAVSAKPVESKPARSPDSQIEQQDPDAIDPNAAND